MTDEGMLIISANSLHNVRRLNDEILSEEHMQGEPAALDSVLVERKEGNDTSSCNQPVVTRFELHVQPNLNLTY